MATNDQLMLLSAREDDAVSDAKDVIEKFLVAAAYAIVTSPATGIVVPPVGIVSRSYHELSGVVLGYAGEHWADAVSIVVADTGAPATVPAAMSAEEAQRVSSAIREFLAKEEAALAAQLAVVGESSADWVKTGFPGFVDSVLARAGALVELVLVGTAANATMSAMRLLSVRFKTAVAAMDAKTTQTCRRINGVSIPVEQPFELTGQPRFADRMMAPPFHWRCRTRLTAA